MGNYLNMLVFALMQHTQKGMLPTIQAILTAPKKIVILEHFLHLQSCFRITTDAACGSPCGLVSHHTCALQF